MIEKSNCPLSLEEARIVADLFRQNRLNTKTDISKEVEFFPIIGDDGTVLMHVFNYGKNNGFVIVGTSKAYMPILAYCDTGNFSTNYKDTGVCVYG